MALSTWTQHEQQSQVTGSVWDAATTTQLNPIGQRVQLGDGRVFRYASTDSNVGVGDVLASTPNVQEVAAGEFGADGSTAPAADNGGSVGDNTIQINIVTGTHTITKDEFAGGYLQIKNGMGEGYNYRILENEANAASGTSTITLKEGLIVALDNTSEGVLVGNPYDNVVTHTAANYGGTPTESIMGTAVRTSTAGTDSTTEYIWVQTWGMAAVQAGTATIIQGGPVQPAEDDNGSAQIPVATEAEIQHIGTCYAGSTDAAATVIADGSWGPVILQIMP